MTAYCNSAACSLRITLTVCLSCPYNSTISFVLDRRYSMHSISYFWHLSRLIYGPRNFQENKRAVVFFARAVANRALFEELYDFFDHYEPMKSFFEQHDPDFQEVMTRVFLFKNSTMRQRLDALKHHFTILRTFFPTMSSTNSTGETAIPCGPRLMNRSPWKRGSSLIRDSARKASCRSISIMRDR